MRYMCVKLLDGNSTVEMCQERRINKAIGEESRQTFKNREQDKRGKGRKSVQIIKYQSFEQVNTVHHIERVLGSTARIIYLACVCVCVWTRIIPRRFDAKFPATE